MAALPTPPAALAADLAAAADFLRADPAELLVSSHVNPDGDGIAGGLALAALARQLGHTPALVLQDAPSVDYSFLGGWDQIRTVAADPDRRAARAAVLDCPTLDRIGAAADLLQPDAAVLNLDHHHDNQRFGTVNLASDEVCSTCEMIYHLAVHMGLEIDREVADQLYTGILFDTGGFRYSLTTPTTLEVGADLVRRGAALDVIADRLFNSSTFDDIKIIGRAIDSLALHCEGRVAVMSLSHADMQRGDPDATVNYGLRVRGVEVSMLLKEEEPGHFRVSLRSREAFDVSALAHRFGGGGHARAAGCRIEGTVQDVTAQLVDAVCEAL